MSTPIRPTPANRNEFIQVMRFVAAALVLITHATFYVHERVDGGVPVWHFGEIGVPIFFVISGIVMVISSVSLPSDTAGAREFMARRLLRILPLYWLVTFAKVAIALAVPSVINHNHFDLGHAVKSFLFIPAYNQDGDIRPIHGVGWTLLHEMFFYVVFATMMLLRTRPALSASALILALYVVGRLAQPHDAVLSVMTSSVNLYFILGMLIGAAAVRSLTGRGPRPSWVLAGLAVFALVKWFAPPGAGIPLDPVVPLVGCAMLVLAHCKMPKFLSWPVALGDSSYALYLFHPFLAPAVLMGLHKLLPSLGPLVAIPVTVLVAITVSHGLHLWLEMPLNRWAKRTFRRPRAPGDVNLKGAAR